MVDRINGVTSKTPGIAHRFVTATPGTLLLALAVVIIYAAPLLHLVLAGTSVAPAFNENIGYRYFYILRAIENPADFTHPIQGTLTGVIQQAIYLALRLVDPAPQNALVEKTNLFALATSLSATVLLALVLIAVARSRAIDFPSKLALFALPLIYEYGSYYGLWFTLLPDYYVLQEPLLILMAFVSLVFAQSALTEGRMVKLVALSGAIMGLLAGLKVTYIVTPALMLGASIFASSRHRARDVAMLTAACGTTYALCLLVYYHGNVSYAVRFVVLLYHWMPALNGILIICGRAAQSGASVVRQWLLCSHMDDVGLLPRRHCGRPLSASPWRSEPHRLGGLDRNRNQPLFRVEARCRDFRDRLLPCDPHRRPDPHLASAAQP